MSDKEMTLWENDELELVSASNPAIPPEEGFHVILFQKKGVPSPWADPELYGRMSVVAAKACGVMEELKLAPWFNIQFNGNLGALDGNPKLHIHIFARRKGKTWGMPVQLPPGSGQFGIEPMSQSDIKRIRKVLAGRL